MTDAQNVPATLPINPDGGHQAVAAKEFAVDHQHQQIFGDWSLHERFQFLSGRRFPVATDTGALDAIALEAAINGSLVVPCRTRPGQLPRRRFLQFPVLLKGLVSGQGHFLILPSAQAWPLQSDFAPGVDHVARLVPVPTALLLTPLAHLLSNLGGHEPLNDGQAQLGGKPLNVLAYPCDQLTHGQLGFQTQSCSISCFFFGLFNLSFVFSHRWFSWFCLLRPTILFDGRQENHLQFQLPAGHFGAAGSPFVSSAYFFLEFFSQIPFFLPPLHLSLAPPHLFLPPPA